MKVFCAEPSSTIQCTFEVSGRESLFRGEFGRVGLSIAKTRIPGNGTANALSSESDLSSPASVEAFRKAAKAFTDTATRTREEAQHALVSAGFRTPTGRLKKPYR